MDYFDRLDPLRIWNIEQNKPTLIAKDLQEYGVPPDTTYKILLGRGVFKWLAVRRDLIRLKNAWKLRVTGAIAAIQAAKREQNHIELAYQRGYLKGYEEARAEVRALCHSARFRAPDCDRAAKAFLSQLKRDLRNRELTESGNVV